MINENLLNIADHYLTEASNTYLTVLNQYYNKKTGNNYPNPDESREDLQQKVVDIASEMNLDVPGKDLRTKANNANRLILANLKNVKPDTEKKTGPKTSITTTGTDTDEAPNDIEQKKFPKYDEFRKKWYATTVSMGWPKDLKVPDVNDSLSEKGIIYPWSSVTKSAYPFNKRGKGVVTFRNYTKKIQDYLYTKFENDLPGLKRLLEKVESIVEVEKQFLKKKPTNFVGTMLLNIFKGIGGTEKDEAILKWLGQKSTGMTIFEYQKYILEEMLTKLSVGDDVSKTLKLILFPLYKQIKNTCEKYFIIEPVKFEDRNFHDNEYQAYFNVKVRPGTKSQQYSMAYSPFVFVLENNVLPLLEGKGIGSKSGRKLESDVDVDDVKGLIKSLKNTTEDEALKKINRSPDIELVYDALDDQNKVIGKYFIEFGYFNKGCKITVGYRSEK